MLKRLIQWLNKFWKRVFGRKRTRSQNRIKRQNVVHQAPELTNADLEVLYNQLLEGRISGTRTRVGAEISAKDGKSD
jgi:hypothetical protein